MLSNAKYSEALAALRGLLLRFKPGVEIYDLIVAPRDEVFAKYQPVFSAVHIPTLAKEEFTSFLYFDNNHHWSGLHRQGLGAAADVGRLRGSLAILLDESRPIRDRFPEALELVTGLGKGIATAVLTVAFPDKYGVWNNTSEAGLRRLAIWPQFERGEGVGARYEKINTRLVALSSDLGIDLWTLDALWWVLLEPDRLPVSVVGSDPSVPTQSSFALERQLEAFLLENWDRTPLGREWTIFSTADNPEAGNQFPTDVGRIDILARHRTQPRLLVVELKRNQTTDQTVGQALRYLGWVKRHVAKDGERVEALIISHKAEKDAQYALSTLADVRMMTYEIEFRLKDPPLLGD